MDKHRSKGSSPSQRQQRVGELLRHALSGRLMRGEMPSETLYDCPLLVGEVRMTADLRCARAYVSFAQQDRATHEATHGATLDEKRAVLQELRRLAPALQKSCAAPLQLKFTPRIAFLWDDLGEQSARIEKLLQPRVPSGVQSEVD